VGEGRQGLAAAGTPDAGALLGRSAVWFGHAACNRMVNGVVATRRDGTTRYLPLRDDDDATDAAWSTASWRASAGSLPPRRRRRAAGAMLGVALARRRSCSARGGLVAHVAAARGRRRRVRAAPAAGRGRRRVDPLVS
jgi:hypothetical protein